MRSQDILDKENPISMGVVVIRLYFSCTRYAIKKCEHLLKLSKLLEIIIIISPLSVYEDE